MGIADTIKGWFGSTKSTASARSDDLVGNAMKTTKGATDKIDPHMDKINDGIDTTARKMDGMTGGKATGAIDKGTDAAKDAMNKMGNRTMADGDNRDGEMRDGELRDGEVGKQNP